MKLISPGQPTEIESTYKWGVTLHPQRILIPHLIVYLSGFSVGLGLYVSAAIPVDP